MRRAIILLCSGILAVVTLVAGRDAERAALKWAEVVPGVLRTASQPYGYALIARDHALLIDAPHGPAGLDRKIDAVLLTHHHRDTCAAAGQFLSAKCAVRAPRASAEWLHKAGVTKHWQSMFPVRGSRVNYLVVPESLDKVDCSLTDDQIIDWQGWTIRVIETPGHSRDHVAYLVQQPGTPRLLFAGDALASPGKLWSPYTTDWDHWTDAGLKPAAASLRKLAALRPSVVLPAHGEAVKTDAVAALEQTAAVVEDNAFLRSFERFTKERVGNAPSYKFLTPEQAKSNGSLPWSRVSEHLWLTGNTFVLVSKDDRNFLVVDPWDPHSAKQIPKLKADQKLGKLEVVLCSHAHFDHFDGIYSLPDRSTFQVWTLDRVAEPLVDPARVWAPFLDQRPLTFDKLPKDGESLCWREYRFRFHHLPGQTEYTMGWETEIDGKRCFFTADNFYHQDQFSGSGGWMGLNRSFPGPYGRSAQKVLDAAPDWVLAEHGGPMEFNAEDFRRRVQWGEAMAKAANALSPSGNHLIDWSPHTVRIEPVLQRGKVGERLKATVIVDNRHSRERKLTIAPQGPFGRIDPFELTVPASSTAKRALLLPIAAGTQPGRLVVTLHVTENGRVDPADAFSMVDVAQ